MEYFFFDETEHEKRNFTFSVPMKSEGDSQTTSNEVEVSIYGWKKVDGNIVWRGAQMLADKLADSAETVERLKGSSVLELGAGSGLLGILCAHLGAHAVITDGDEKEFPVLARNAECFEDMLSNGGSISASVLEWGRTAGLKAVEARVPGLIPHSFDFIVASDVVYIPQYIPDLAESIEFFLAPQGVAIITNTAVSTRTNHQQARELFLTALEAQGLIASLEMVHSGKPATEGHRFDYTVRIRRPDA